MGSAAIPIADCVPPGQSVARPINEASAADHGWVAELVEREGEGILRMLWRILGREQDVMDAYQDCFCKLTQRGNVGDLRNTRAFAYRTAANIAIEMIRCRKRRAAHWPRIAKQREARQTEATKPIETSAAASASSEQRERLRAAIAQLPAHLRNVVVLRDLSNMSYEDVGRTLGVEPTTARVYRRHAVVKLAELLNQGESS